MTPNWSKGFDPALLASAQGDDFKAFIARFNQLAAARGLQTGQGRALQFLPQEQLPAGSSYESHIALTGEVPTRDNLHDRFNTLVWLHAPRTKAMLNRLQAVESQRLGGTGPRGNTRDAATLMDENLALLVYRKHPPPLRDRDWKSLFWDQRGHWGQEWTILVFGHALMEKLQQPYLSLTAHCICLRLPTDEWIEVDAALEEWIKARSCQTAQLERTEQTERTERTKKKGPATEEPFHEEALGPRSLCPLPLMGIPGWHADNSSEAFYNNDRIFRPQLNRAVE